MIHAASVACSLRTATPQKATSNCPPGTEKAEMRGVWVADQLADLRALMRPD